MRFFAVPSSLIAITYLALTARALPRPAATYSVVNVGGGVNGQPPSSTPTTIYETVTQPASSQEITVSVTIVETPSVTTTATLSQASSSAASSETTSSSSSSSSSNTPISSSAASPAPPGVSTVTIVSIETPPTSSTSTSYYDDGQWHTTYPIKLAYANTTATWNSTQTTSTRALYPTATDAHIAGRAAASGAGAYSAGRAARASYNVVSWDESNNA